MNSYSSTNENITIIQEFKKLVNQLEYKISQNEDSQKNSFRLKHIKNAYKIISKYPQKITSGDDIKHIYGIGKGIIKRIDEILENGKLSEITTDYKSNNNNKEKCIEEELSKVIGIGPSKAKELVKEYDISSVKDLIKKHSKGIVKLNDKILVGLKYYNKLKLDIPRKEMILIEKYIIDSIEDYDENYIVTICGSYRRKKKTSNDIDVLITNKLLPKKINLNSKKNYLQGIVNHLKEKKFIIDDMDNKGKIKYMGFCKYKNKPVRRIDIRLIPYESRSTALLYFTGSKEFNEKIRKIAKKKNYKLNEYGLYKISTDDKKTMKQIKLTCEKDIFDILGVDYLEPHER